MDNYHAVTMPMANVPLDWQPCSDCGQGVGLGVSHQCPPRYRTAGYGGIVVTRRPSNEEANRQYRRNGWHQG